MRLSSNPFCLAGVLVLTAIFIRSTTVFAQDSLSYEIIHLSNRYCPPLENPDNVCSTIEINTVKFQNAQIGQAIQSKIDKEIISSAFYDNCTQVEDCVKAIEVSTVDETSETEVNVFVRYNQNGILSLDLGFMSNYYGSAHPMYFSKTMNFDATTGASIQLSDIVNSVKLKEFNLLAERQFIKENGSEGWDFQPGNFKVNDRFVLHGQGMTFYFDAYELGTYAMGPAELTLTWGAIKPFLKPGTPVSRIIGH